MRAAAAARVAARVVVVRAAAVAVRVAAVRAAAVAWAVAVRARGGESGSGEGARRRQGLLQ